MAPANKPATYADIEALPEHVVGEIVDGELFVSPRPSPRQAYAKGAVHSDLVHPFDRGAGGPGGWWLLLEPELHLGGNVFVPDIAGWRIERLPTLPDQVGITVNPDWVCEVLSATTGALDRKKVLAYGLQGIERVWLIDPILRTLELFSRRDYGMVYNGMTTDDSGVRVPPFETTELDMTTWWPPSSPAEANSRP